MNEVILIACIVITVIISTALILLFNEHKKLKQRFDTLSTSVEQNNKDIAGLCSAAVSVDSSLLESHEQLKSMKEILTDLEQHEQQTAQPYYSAIQRVREGAGVDELTQECGLSQDEAVLLIRLHGNSANKE